MTSLTAYNNQLGGTAPQPFKRGKTIAKRQFLEVSPKMNLMSWFARYPMANQSTKRPPKKRKRKMTIENVIASMMTENTGTHFLDSGGAYGRNWQRNQGLTVGATVDALKEMPSATLEVSIRDWRGKPHAELIPTVNIFHKLTGGVLEIDDRCETFNAMPVPDWGGDLSASILTIGAPTFRKLLQGHSLPTSMMAPMSYCKSMVAPMSVAGTPMPSYSS
jgi:hypothetical protein